MAVAVDQASIGTQATTSTTSSNMTTTAAVASGALIVAVVGRWQLAATSTMSMSGGTLTWTQAHTVTSGSLRMSVFYAFAPAGLASGSTLTVTCNQANNDITWCAASYTGADSVLGHTAFNGAAATSTAWNSGSVAAAAGESVIGGSWGDGTLSTSTATAPGVERIDFNSATTSGSVTLVDKLGVGAAALVGTWNNSITQIAIGVSFAPSAGAAAASAPIARKPARGLVMHSR